MSQATTNTVSLRVRVQKFGTFLSSMIMPNIGAFIAWGLLTALFLWSEDPEGGRGPFANEQINTLVGPMVIYLLPILIAYTGGKLIYEHRGGVVGAAATMGVILGTSSPVFIGPDGSGSPMFLGAMIMGPAAAWCMKKLDGLWAGRIKPGFEMLVDNFSAGIFAALAAIASMFLLTPVMNAISAIAGSIVDWLVAHSLLPLTSLLIEPAKVLFLNNAINHGVITPLATEQAMATGKSMLFLLEANPGPGLGILLAYIFFGRGSAKSTAPGAALIHFFGGIHEIYFPYILMKPQLLVAAIAGGASGVAMLQIFDAGLRSPAAPGSIIAVLASTASDSYVGVCASVLAATLVSFVLAALILRFSPQGDDDLAAAAQKMQDMKGKKSSVAAAFASGQEQRQIKAIVFACDAGMGSSAMGASVLRQKIKEAGFGQQVSVVNSAINNLKDDFDLLVCHQDLADRAAAPTPSAIHVAVDNFMNSPRYDEIVEMIRQQHAAKDEVKEEDQAGADSVSESAASLLALDSIVLDREPMSRDQAIEEAGQLLLARGSVTSAYVRSMHEREESVSTFMGNGLAIPHGTNAAKEEITSSAISFIRFKEPVDWNGKQVIYTIGIAGAGGDHLKLLEKIAKIFSSKDLVAQLDAATSAQEIITIFDKVA